MMLRRLLCYLRGHQWFRYTDADYMDCTRCGLSMPTPRVTIH